MKEASNQSGKTAKIMGFLGLGLCALCCTLPIVGIIGGAGVLATIALYAEKVAVILLIISTGFFVYWFYKRKQNKTACTIDCSCKNEGEACTSGK